MTTVLHKTLVIIELNEALVKTTHENKEVFLDLTVQPDASNQSQDKILLDFIAALKKNITVKMLRFDMKFGEEGLEILSEMIKENKGLKGISFEISIALSRMEVATRPLCDALSLNQTLTNLDLSDSYLHDAGAKVLSEILENNTVLLKMVLKRNRITAVGAEYLSKALQVNTHLKELCVSYNPIADTGAKAFGEALKVNTSLDSINLSATSIKHEGLNALIDMLKINKDLISINLSELKLELNEENILHLAEMFQLNTTLAFLSLSTSFLSRDNHADHEKSLLSGLKKNHRLTTFHFNNASRDQINAITSNHLEQIQKNRKEFPFSMALVLGVLSSAFPKEIILLILDELKKELPDKKKFLGKFNWQVEGCIDFIYLNIQECCDRIKEKKPIRLMETSQPGNSKKSDFRFFDRAKVQLIAAKENPKKSPKNGRVCFAPLTCSIS